MRIVQICPYDFSRPGGVQHHIRDLSSALTARGHEVLIVSPGPSDGTSVLHHRIGIMRPIRLSGTKFELTWGRRDDLRSFNALTREWAPDLLHFHTIWSPFLPFQLLSAWRGASVATFHDTPPDGFGGLALKTMFRALSWYLAERIDQAIAVSPAPLAHLSRRWGARVNVVPPAVDLARMTAHRRSNRRAAEAVSFLFVGRLEPRKGILQLLSAWSALVRTGSIDGVRLIVAGEGDLLPQVLRERERLGPDRLEFINRPGDDVLKDLYARADVLIAPSPYGESFGIILTEAMSNGLPVIAAANQGYPHLLSGPGAVGLVPPGDSEALATCILKFARDADLRSRLGEWGRRHATKFDIETVVKDIEAIYARAQVRHAGRVNR